VVGEARRERDILVIFFSLGDELVWWVVEGFCCCGVEVVKSSICPSFVVVVLLGLLYVAYVRRWFWSSRFIDDRKVSIRALRRDLDTYTP
jgi:hypothetical protein